MAALAPQEQSQNISPLAPERTNRSAPALVERLRVQPEPSRPPSTDQYRATASGASKPRVVEGSPQTGPPANIDRERTTGVVGYELDAGLSQCFIRQMHSAIRLGPQLANRSRLQGAQAHTKPLTIGG